MANYDSQYTGEQVDAAVRNSTKVVANPDISGTTPASLTSLEVAGTKYKVAADITVDSALSSTSENPVQNKVINSALNGKQSTIDSSHQLSSDLVTDSGHTNKFVTTSEKNTWNGKSTVSVSSTGTATDEISYITIDGIERKIAGGGSGGGGSSSFEDELGVVTTWAQIIGENYDENNLIDIESFLESEVIYYLEYPYPMEDSYSFHIFKCDTPNSDCWLNIGATYSSSGGSGSGSGSGEAGWTFDNDYTGVAVPSFFSNEFFTLMSMHVVVIDSSNNVIMIRPVSIYTVKQYIYTY